MNRLESYLVRSESRTSVNIAEPSDASFQIDLSFAHRLFVPEYYEPGYQYPLVIWLHSDDSSEYELDDVMPHLSLRNYVGLGLRGTRSGTKRGRYKWSLNANSLALNEEMVFQSISQLDRTLSIQTQNVFLAGYGKAGSVAQQIALRHPERFAAAISINGRFPQAPKCLARWKQTRQLPILWMHGTQSSHCGMDAMCQLLNNAYTAGLKVFPVQFPVGDELDSTMLAKANRFMMQIVTGEPIQLFETVA
jgi:phospholipase/carboxylesterase